MAQISAGFGQQFTVNAVDFSSKTDFKLNILKRRERTYYRSFLASDAANVAYVSSNQVNALSSISIFDRSASLSANRNRTAEEIELISKKTFILDTNRFLITDVFTELLPSIPVTPIYYKHVISKFNLPRQSDGIEGLSLANSVSLLNVELLTADLEVINTPEISIDYNQGIVYTNLISSFRDIEDFTIYYIRYSVNDSSSIKTYTDLLSSQEVFRLAELDDLNPSTLLIKEDGRKVYLIEEIPGGYLITLPITSNYSVKPTEDSKISISPPESETISEPWFISVSNGEFNFNINNTNYKYHLAEFIVQDFDPVYPIKTVTTEESTILSNKLIKLDKRFIFEDHNDLGLYVQLQINDSDNNGIAAYTTFSGIEDNIADNSVSFKVWNEIDRVGIKSIDRNTGILELDGINLRSSWKVNSSYSFSEKDYEFNLINFNPFLNSSILTTQTSLFIDPSSAADPKTQNLYYLISDQSGKVISSNWSLFNNASGVLNNGNILYYEDLPSFYATGIDSLGNNNYLDPDTLEFFVDDYTTVGSGILLLLGDITVGSSETIDTLNVIDARRRGGGIIDSNLEEVLEIEPEVEFYWDVGRWDGKPYPGNASYLVEVPVDVLNGAGGEFSQKKVRDIIDRHTAAGVYPVAKAYGVDVTITGVNPGSTSMYLSWIGKGF